MPVIIISRHGGLCARAGYYGDKCSLVWVSREGGDTEGENDDVWARVRVRARAQVHTSTVGQEDDRELL